MCEIDVIFHMRKNADSETLDLSQSLLTDKFRFNLSVTLPFLTDIPHSHSLINDYL